MDVKRHTCILCKKKKTANIMLKTRSHWTCHACLSCPDQRPAVHTGLRVLNLYAGIGGNRKFWKGCSVTAIERDLNVAAAYKSLYPEDTLIIGDAHAYLLKHYNEFDFIWSSPPCQSHSRMNYWTPFDKKRYVDISLYQEIILLQQFFRGSWVVENVKPYYQALIDPSKTIGRHYFWSNLRISDIEVPQVDGFINLETIEDKQIIMKWLGIHYEKNIYLSGKNYLQVFRNCVHPDIGLSIFNDFIRANSAPPTLPQH